MKESEILAVDEAQNLDASKYTIDHPKVRQTAEKMYKKGLNPQTIRNTLKAMYNL